MMTDDLRDDDTLGGGRLQQELEETCDTLGSVVHCLHDVSTAVPNIETMIDDIMQLVRSLTYARARTV